MQLGRCPKAAFVNTPKGIFTQTGRWFRIEEASLRSYAGAVLEKEPLEGLLGQADVWLRSPKILALWLLPGLLFLAAPAWVAGGVLAAYIVWTLGAPALVSRHLGRAFCLLDQVLLQAIYYVLTMSILAEQHQFGALATGFLGFVLLRWGLVESGLDPWLQRVWPKLYRMPVPDMVLRSFIIRAALHHRIPLAALDLIEQRIFKGLKP